MSINRCKKDIHYKEIDPDFVNQNQVSLFSDSKGRYLREFQAKFELNNINWFTNSGATGGKGVQ